MEKKKKRKKMVGVVTFLLARLARLVCGARIIVPSEQEQEQSSLYIVHNKFLITSSDSVETKEASDLFI